MRLIIALVLVNAFIVVSGAQESETTVPPLKIDRNLRRALLKALENLEEESQEDSDNTPTAEKLVKDLPTSSFNSKTKNIQDIDRFKGASITFDQFNNDGDEVPGEDKLQNSTYVETDKYETGDLTAPAISEVLKTTERVIFQKIDPLLGNKTPIEKFSESLQSDQVETRSIKPNRNDATVNTIENSLKPTIHERESLAISSSNGIVSASVNSLPLPSPTMQSPIAPAITRNVTAPFLPTTSLPTAAAPIKSEVNIFKAPLVAAFTVQQDESGLTKSVVPIYKPNGNGQALTLQEQLEFKQQLLEKQLAELQAQQIQQTEFLLRQRQLYQEQQRQKQRQQFYLQEQARLKQLEEQRDFQKQRQQLSIQQLPLQQPLGAFTQNNLQTFQLPLKTPVVQFQPSLEFQLPSAVAPPPFQTNIAEPLRFQPQRQQLFNTLQQQQRQQQQQQQQQQLQLQRQQLVQKEHRLQQSFPTFPIEFQPPLTSSPSRFNRQEGFGSVGNAGINSNSQLSDNHLNLDVSRPPIQSFVPFHQFNNFSPVRPQRVPTSANQIQQLLYQSGVARDLGTNPISGTNQEDLNIVSKVLALNVGALPITHNLKYTNNGFGRT